MPKNRKKEIEVESFYYTYPKNMRDFENSLREVNRRAWVKLNLVVKETAKEMENSYKAKPATGRLELATHIAKAVTEQANALAQLAKIVSPEVF